MLRSLLLSVMLLLSVLGTARAQERTITGRVTASEDGTLIPGANITVKGSPKGTTTNAKGVYK